MLSVTRIFLNDEFGPFGSIQSCALLTSEAELHLSVRPARKVGDPVQGHTDGHGDRSEDVHGCLQLSTLHSPWRVAKGVRRLEALLRWNWMRLGREPRHGAAPVRRGRPCLTRQIEPPNSFLSHAHSEKHTGMEGRLRQ